jgi:hypothetical protein
MPFAATDTRAPTSITSRFPPEQKKSAECAPVESLDANTNTADRYYVRRSPRGNHNGSSKSQRLWESLNTKFDARTVY